MPKITFTLLLALVMAEFILTRQVSPLALVPFVFSIAQAFFPAAISDDLSPSVKWVLVLAPLPFLLLILAEILYRPSVVFTRITESPSEIINALYLVPICLLLYTLLRSKRATIRSKPGTQKRVSHSLHRRPDIAFQIWKL